MRIRKMNTKIVIIGKAGDAIKGQDMFLEVDGAKVDGEISLSITAKHNEVATATVTMILPEIEYREASNE